LDKPNVIFVLVDTLRADRLGRYGRTPSITPNMDALGEEGVIFERAIAQAPWTQPSIASMFSSFNPSVHRVFSYRQISASPQDAAQKVAVFSERFKTLVECLKEAGYATAGINANPFVLQKYGFAQGFDHYDSSMASQKSLASGDVVNDAAVAWLAQRDTRKPFFLYLHYMDVHGPYNAGPEFLDDLLDEVERSPQKQLLTALQRNGLGYLGKLPPNCPNLQRHRRLTRFREYWIARYESGVREFDHHFGELRTKLKEMGLWEDSYIVLTSDHGEALCEHDFWSHGFSTHHTDLHVPLVLRWPGELPEGRWVSGTVRLIDVMPTLLDQLTLPVPAGIQGVSLTSVIEGKPLDEPLPALAEGVKVGPKQRAVYVDTWKLMVTLETGRKQLFDLYNDYHEYVDLSLSERDRVDSLVAVLEEQAELNDRLAIEYATGQTTVPAEQLERLKELGYVGD
jgi:arylsulfatase A-like enzyme